MLRFKLNGVTYWTRHEQVLETEIAVKQRKKNEDSSIRFTSINEVCEDFYYAYLTFFRPQFKTGLHAYCSIVLNLGDLRRGLYRFDVYRILEQ